MPSTTAGLDYMHARYFSPNLGRFHSVDPVGAAPSWPQSWNRYSYVLGNPVKYTDPRGLIWWPSSLNVFDQLPYFDSITVTGALIPLPTRGFDDSLLALSLLMNRPHSGQGGGAGGFELSFTERLLSSIPAGFAQNTGEAVVGFGDTLSFGLTDLYRTEAGLANTINEDSGAYLTGQVAGVAHGLALGGAGAARAAGYQVKFLRYSNAGGGGVNLLNGGRRIFAIDWHRFKLAGRMVNRPHFHAGLTKSQLRKHRPWQGGWIWW